jgi:DamX protein
MSVVAHTSIDDNNITSVQLNSEPAVTSISVSARIDYIQRFSKQTVLVIDNDVDVYTQAARQFLINLSKEKSAQESNVAFVSASTKLNDIQMRCRLIEQLFANTLFDPEKSLAVSIINLSKESKDSITIVIEHAHALSLQIKYELCQLVDVANKTHRKINVVLFGQEQAAQDAAVNKTIFKNKLAIIDAKSGQLFSLDHAKFNSDNSIFTKKFWQRLLITVVTISTVIGLSWFMLIEYDNFNLYQLPIANVNSSDEASIKPDSTLTNTRENKLVNDEVLLKKNQANISEIHAALLGKKILNIEVVNRSAKAEDILKALDLSGVQVTTPQMKETEMIVSKSVVGKSEIVKLEKIKEIKSSQVIVQEKNKLPNTDSPLILTPNYYLSASTGFVVQIVGFTDMALLTRFTDKYPNLEYFSYQKKLNGQLFVVLTTKIFENKEQAREALQFLPQAITERGVWVKALSTVQNEINIS